MGKGKSSGVAKVFRRYRKCSYVFSNKLGKKFQVGRTKTLGEKIEVGEK